jgi:hypothetical protein
MTIVRGEGDGDNGPPGNAGIPARGALGDERPGACFEIAERPPAAPSHISARMGRDVRIRYSTVGAVPSSTSGALSSGKLWR